MAKLYFRYGAMGSSKTANAVMVRYNYEERGFRVLMLKPQMENRDGERIVRSRCGLEAVCSFVEELPEMDLTGYACIIVDEAHFMTAAQVRRLSDIADDLDIPVICYGLRTDFRGELFEGSRELMCLADSIEEIKTICWCGKKATFNARISNGKVVKEGEQVMLGGNDRYISLCRKHWKNGDLGNRSQGK
ncbi:MAG: thymidine kinase [Clostridia bacterium]|nr:thymidine kinase [Clostridia bacterium]